MHEGMVARGHGWFNIVSGLWPLLHMGSFERVSGPKNEHWLVQTVAGLLLSNGVVQVLAAPSPDALVHARRVGVGTASVTIQVAAGWGGVQGVPMMASRSASRTLMRFLRAVEM